MIHTKLNEYIRFSFVCIFFVSFSLAQAQVAVDEKGTFLFVGATTGIFGKHNLASYYGYSPSDNFQAFAVLPFFNLHKNIQFMPGYVMSKSDGNKLFTNLRH